MHDKSEGYKKRPEKKILPRLRGEIWTTYFHGTVTVLKRIRGGAVEVMNEKGRTEVLWDSQFKARL